MNKKKTRSYLNITTGTFLMALAVKGFFEPVNLVTGGFSGFAIIIKEITVSILGREIPVWLTTAFLNIPLFIAAVRFKGWSFMKKSITASVLFSLFLSIIPKLCFVGEDRMLAALFGGGLNGLGIGLILNEQSTTGGTDLLASLIQLKIPGYSVVHIMQILDGLVIVLGIYLFGLDTALYAAISIITLTKISDGIIEGVKYAKTAYIISEKNIQIEKEILEKMDRGVTRLKVTGGYSGEEKEMLMCVTGKREIVKLKTLVMGIDRKAFMVVGDAREVLGEGFIYFS